MRSSGWMVAGIGLLVLGALVCFSTLLSWDISSGRSYPRCSSLRVDPLGSKALYEALTKTPGITCERNFQALHKLEGRRDSVLLLLNANRHDLGSGHFMDGKAVQQWIAQGGRAVITLSSDFGPASKRHGHAKEEDQDSDDDDAALRSHDVDHLAAVDRQSPKDLRSTPEKSIAQPKAPTLAPKDGPGNTSPTDKKDQASDKKSPQDQPASPADEKKREKEKEEADYAKKHPSVQDTLGFLVHGDTFVAGSKDGFDAKWEPRFPVPAADLPKWHNKTTLESALDEDADNPWKIWARDGKKPVLMERRLGRGSVVVAADSYFATNEALYRDPHPAFLTWLLGGANRIVFDETHLGVHESSGVMSLAFRHHLHGLFIGALVLFLLLLWKGHSTLVPRLDVGQRERHNITAGFGATAGFVSLLRRGLPRARLLRQCLEAWEKSHRDLSPVAQTRLAKAQQILAEEEAKPARQRQLHLAYGKICAALHLKH